MHRFNRTTLPATQWKNGGGVTREIVVRPHGAGLDSFTWRVSIADVSANGPFSSFAGVDRVLAILDGDGVVLRDPDGRLVRRLDQPFVPFSFSGDEPLLATLIGGASSDFNVMTRRGVARADVRVVRTDETLAASSGGVLFAARGRWSIRAVRDSAMEQAMNGDESEISLDAGDGCWWADESVAWHVAPDAADAVRAVLLVVQVRAAATADDED